jgi:hypothetical protein
VTGLGNKAKHEIDGPSVDIVRAFSFIWAHVTVIFCRGLPVIPRLNCPAGI